MGICEAGAYSAHGFPRGEAVERSETDEERRTVSITNAVREKGTILSLYLPI